VNGSEFIRAIKKLAKDRGVTVREDENRGKGSHMRFWYGERWTTVKDRKKELGPGLLAAMLVQLGLSKKDIQ
jgi:predicted RNA binding protein YcfA (HicA-like mRNA interferase family)